VLVPLSGGGLAGGIAAAVKVLRPQTRVIGISMERGAAMHSSLVAGNPVLVEEVPTLADSLGGGIGLNNRYTFALARDLLDDVLLVSEDAIAHAIRHAHADQQKVIEGAAAVGIAALLAGEAKPRGPAVVVVSGGNIDPKLHRTIIGRMD
jgi:threonine dehydratase